MQRRTLSYLVTAHYCTGDKIEFQTTYTI